MSKNVSHNVINGITEKKDFLKLDNLYLNNQISFPTNKKVKITLQKLREDKTKKHTSNEKKVIRYLKDNNKFEEAFNKSKELLKIDKNDPEIYALMGDISKELQNYPVALEAYMNCFKIDRNYERCTSKLYNFLMQIEPSIFLDKWVQTFELILSDKKNLGQKKLFII